LKNGVDALKESSANQPTIWISSFQRDDGKLEVQIQDNGIGIKTADLSKIFELGWSSKKGEGMGFGLFWAKDYIEGLGGHIKCESAYKKGTTFLITMPMGNNQS
jgi:signal transduction histidine kinase